MEPRGTAVLTDEIPAARAVTAVISRHEVAGALQDPEHTPELFLDIDRPGEERSTIGIGWSRDELEQILGHASDEDIVLTFDRDELLAAFDDVEAHGLRQTAAIFAVTVAGALGSGAAIANASPMLDRGADSAATVATVQTDSAASAAAIKLSTEPAAAVDDSFISNAHTPGTQLEPAESSASAAAVKLSTEPTPAVDHSFISNARTPGVQLEPNGSTVTPSASVSTSQAADDGYISNVHTPGMQLEPAASTGSTTPAVKVSAGSSDGEFLGVDTRDATEALIAGGVLLAIAGATFAGTRRPGSARPA
jgi:hypothetical protein